MYRLVTPASASLLSRALVKDHVRVDQDDTDYDTLLDGFKAAAEQQVRAVVGPLLPETWTATFRAADTQGRLYVENGPHLAMTKVEIMISGAYVEQDVNSWVSRGLDQRTTIVKPKAASAQSPGRWPQADVDEEAYRVTYQSGYATAGDVPQPIIAAMLLIVGNLFANRSQMIPANLVENPTVAALLRPFRAASL